MQALADRGCEASWRSVPSPTLIGMGRRCLPEGDYAWLPSLRPGRDDWQTMLDSLAELYVRGAKIDWAGFDRDYRRGRPSCPPIPFQRRRYWANAADRRCRSRACRCRNAAAASSIRCWAAAWRPPSSEQVFESQIAANRPAMLADHKIQGWWSCRAPPIWKWRWPPRPPCTASPGASAASRSSSRCCLDKTPKTVQTILTPEGPSAASFRIVSVTQSDGRRGAVVHHARRRAARIARRRRRRDDRPGAERGRFTGEPRDEHMADRGPAQVGSRAGTDLLAGALCHWVERARGAGRAPRAARRRPGRRLPDSSGLARLRRSNCWGPLLPGAGEGIDAYVPMSVDRLQLYDRPQGPAWYSASLTSLKSNVAVGDIQLMDASGRVLVKLEGVRLRRVPRDWLARRLAGPLPDWCYELAWVPQPLDAAAADAEPAEPGQWLIFDSPDGLGAALAERLEMKGHRCTLVPAGGDAESRRAAVREFLSTQRAGTPRHRLSLGPGRGRPAGSARLRRGPPHGWGGVLDLVQALADVGRGRTAATVAGDPRRPGRGRSARCRLAWPNRRSGAWGE